jgi:hypothetical protein
MELGCCSKTMERGEGEDEVRVAWAPAAVEQGQVEGGLGVMCTWMKTSTEYEHGNRVERKRVMQLPVRKRATASVPYRPARHPIGGKMPWEEQE